MHLQSTSPSNEKNVSVVWDVYEATKYADVFIQLVSHFILGLKIYLLWPKT